MSDMIVYVGDTFPIQVSWSVPDAENPYVETDAVISAATVTVIRNKDRKIIVDNEAATISGNETIFTVPNASLTGAHTAYVTVELNDDTVLTQEVSYYVRSK